MNIAKMLETMEIEDLKFLEEEVKKGKIKEIIDERKNKDEQKTCAVCGEKFPKIKGLVLEFGSAEFRRRAHFCAMDCMEYFLKSLKSKGGEYY